MEPDEVDVYAYRTNIRDPKLQLIKAIARQLLPVIGLNIR